jgi:hypothetical protein
MKDFSPIFSTIPEFNQIDALIDLTLITNKAFRDLETKFTAQSVFGNGLASVLEKYFNILSKDIDLIQKSRLDIPKVVN